MSSSATMETGYACVICDTVNPPGSAMCSECAAPLVLGEEAQAQGQKPTIISMLGDSNVGKTVYLGFLLDMLSQRANNFEAVPRGSYSVNVQQLVISHMAYRMFPPKTSVEQDTWNWAYYQIAQQGRNQKWFDLVMPDIAGEAIAAEVAAPNTFQIIQSLLGKAAGLLLLVDAALAGSGSAQPDFFTLKMLSYVDSLRGGGRRKKINMPIAMILTKSDHFPECFEDPARFAKANLNRTWNMCQARFSNTQFFASTVVGSLGYATKEKEDFVTPIPLHTALHGILEPFEWIVGQL